MSLADASTQLVKTLAVAHERECVIHVGVIFRLAIQRIQPQMVMYIVKIADAYVTDAGKQYYGTTQYGLIRKRDMSAKIASTGIIPVAKSAEIILTTTI